MFDIYIKDFNQNGSLVTTETLVQSIPASSQGDLKLLQPIVKCEMGNAESFNFNIESGTKFYDSFNQMKTFMRVVYDGDTIFYGRVLTIENSFYGTRKIRLEGPLAFLNDSSIYEAEEKSRPKLDTYEYLSDIINSHNKLVDDSKRSFTLGEVPGHYSGNVSGEQEIASKNRKYGQEGWHDTKSVIEDLRSHFGGYLRVRCPGYRSGDTFVDQGHYLDWMDQYFNQNENTQTIEVGKNVLDISTSTEIDNIFTVVIPIGNTKTKTTETVDGEKKSTTPKHFYVDGYEVTVPSICAKYGNALNFGYHTYDDYANAINDYGRIIKTVTFDDATSKSNLLKKCQEWIKINYQGKVTKFTIKAVDMHQIGDTNVSKIMVGDRVRIIYPVGTESGHIEKRSIVRTCLSISYDLYNPENNAYTFGIPANILTKSYGVAKQGKSTTQPSTTPKAPGSSGSDKTEDWLDKVTDWLMHHQIRYKHTADGKSIDGTVYPSLFPWNQSRTQYEKGPRANIRDNRFYQTETGNVLGSIVSRFMLWTFTPKTSSTNQFNQAELNRLLKQVEEGMKGMPAADIQSAKKAAEDGYRKSLEYTEYTAERIGLTGILTHEQIMQANIIPYVKQEYGINLGNFENTLMPDITYTDASGVTKTESADKSGSTIITKDMFKKGYNGERPTGWHLIMTPDGREVASCQDENGNWTYWAVDADGNVIPTDIRDLTVRVIEGEKAFGQLIHDDFALVYDPETGGTKYEPHDYIFGQAVENWADSKMVHAWVDGDVVLIGSNATQFATMVAQNIGGSMIHPVQYATDPVTGDKSAIWVGDTGQMSYEAYWSKSSHCYLPVPYDYYHRWSKEAKQAWLYENGPIVNFTGDGFWDTNTLAIKGGVASVEDPETGKKITYINSSLTVCGDPAKPGQRLPVLDALYTAGVITDDEADDPKAQALVASAVYAEDMYAINGHFHTIETDYLKTNTLESNIAKLKAVTVSNLKVANYGLVVTPSLYIGDKDDNTTAWINVATTAISHVDYTRVGETYYLHCYDLNNDETEKTKYNQVNFNLKTEIGRISNVHVNTLVVDKTTGYVMTPFLYIGEEGNAYNVAQKAISSASLNLSGNTYSLHFFNLDNDELEITKNNKMTFSRATTLSMAWSSGYGTVTASPQGTKYKFRMATNTKKSSTFSTKWKNVVLDEYYVPGNQEYISTEEACSVSIDCSDIYANGWSAARNTVSGKTYSVSNYSYSYFPTTEVGLAYRLEYMKVAMPNSTVDGAKSDYTYYVTAGSGVAYIRYGNKEGPVVAKVNHDYVKTQAEYNMYGTDRYNSGYDAGWTNCHNDVSLPGVNTSSNACILKIPNSSVDGTPLSRTYRIYKSTAWNANAYVYLYDETNSREVARLPVGSLYTAGANSVSTTVDDWRFIYDASETYRYRYYLQAFVNGQWYTSDGVFASEAYNNGLADGTPSSSSLRITKDGHQSAEISQTITEPITIRPSFRRGNNDYIHGDSITIIPGNQEQHTNHFSIKRTRAGREADGSYFYEGNLYYYDAKQEKFVACEDGSAGYWYFSLTNKSGTTTVWY